MRMLVSKVSITSMVILAAAGFAPVANAQLLTSWTFGCTDDGSPDPDCVNSWLTDVATGQFVNVGSSPSVRNLAADNATGRVFAAGSLLLTFQAGDDGELTEVSSELIVDADGTPFATPTRFQSLGFANGLLYGTVAGGSSVPPGFYAMDPETAVATLLAPSGEIPVFPGLDYNPDDGLLYAITGPNTGASIVSIDVATLTVTHVVDVPPVNLGGVQITFDGVAVGDGRVYLSNGNADQLPPTPPIPVYNIAAGVFEASLPSPPKSGENGFYPSGATFFAPLVPTSPGDVDGDGDVDLGDFAIFADCLAGPGGSIPPGCDPDDFAASDLDGDEDADLADFAEFQINFGS